MIKYRIVDDRLGSSCELYTEDQIKKYCDENGIICMPTLDGSLVVDLKGNPLAEIVI